VHDASVRAHPQSFSWGYRLLNNLMVSMLAPRVDTVMTVSRFSANELRLHFHLTRDDWVVGREGWEHVGARPPLDDAAVLRRHGLVSGGYLLAVGGLKAHKNLDLVARALRLLDAGHTLPVAVAGGFDSRVYQGVEPPGDAAMRWLGFVPDDELHVLYGHAAWFIFPSLYEGFGLPPLEAMANGCPVLAARAGPIPEIYGDAVLYFDAHDPSSLATLLREVTTGGDALARRDEVKRRAATCLAHQRWEANAEILLDRLIAVGAVAIDVESIETFPCVASVAPLSHS
jgi:glycosyltransferase involved in cell wall biosynthesis